MVQRKINVAMQYIVAYLSVMARAVVTTETAAPRNSDLDGE
jgi:hypothetical protein